MLHLALFQPDIPQNTGTILRMAACFDLHVNIIEPAGFDVSDRNFRRAGMDYLDALSITRHISWTAFQSWQRNHNYRLILTETDGSIPYTQFSFRPDDIILLGRETAGVPSYVYEAADESVHIPVRPGLRSLNVAIAAAMVVGEAMRQIRST